MTPTTLLDGTAGLHGWQWLLIMESIPAIMLGLAALVSPCR
jgi:hypothetical protein